MTTDFIGYAERAVLAECDDIDTELAARHELARLARPGRFVADEFDVTTTLPGGHA